MRETFGNPISRLLNGGVTLTTIEKKILKATIEALPPILRSTAETQLGGFNLVQREIDGRALNFYRKKFGRVIRDGLPVLPIKKGEIKLLALAFSIPGRPDSFHVTATAIDGYFFCLAFSHDLRPFAACDNLSVTKVTESWRSSLATSAQRAEQPPRGHTTQRGQTTKGSCFTTFGGSTFEDDTEQGGGDKSSRQQLPGASTGC
jgi:hypothetical protein